MIRAASVLDEIRITWKTTSTSANCTSPKKSLVLIEVAITSPLVFLMIAPRLQKPFDDLMDASVLSLYQWSGGAAHYSSLWF